MRTWASTLCVEACPSNTFPCSFSPLILVIPESLDMIPVVLIVSVRCLTDHKLRASKGNTSFKTLHRPPEVEGAQRYV